MTNQNNYRNANLLCRGLIGSQFKSGNSQAVQIPSSFRLDLDTIEILQGKNGDVILRPFKPKADLNFLELFLDFDENLINTLEN
ncbi:MULTISPECIES: antitoxin [Avibacterium]|uniref:antitoxin n=1 Tax=Avibacterium TaxID=292486 RepID=UPI001FE31583|nr:AbrB/MazE/SpoVT family DNA-binding domain-containing protein [Avibacterium endocarditidis]